MKKTIKTFTLLVSGLVLFLMQSCTEVKQTEFKEIEPITAPFDMPQLQRPVFPDRTFHIMDFGAIGDGETLNITAFADAINACSNSGGGKVIVPGGTWLTVPIELKSNVNLHLEEGATILFTYDKIWYFPDSLSRVHGDLRNPVSPIHARNAENIAITGTGILDGHGIGWWPLQESWWNRNKKFYGQEFYDEVWEGINTNISNPGDVTAHMELQAYYGGVRPVAIRPNMLKPVNCNNILLEGFTIQNSPMWTINPVMCENIIIRKVTIRTLTGNEFHDSPNTDGIVPESSKNVLIEYCDIFTGDDSYAIKSGIDEAGRIRNIPSENIVIRHSKNKRISIGSEMSGGVRNVYIHDCKVTGGMNRAIHIKTRRGRGGIVENIWFENIHSDTVKESTVLINMLYGERPFAFDFSGINANPYDPESIEDVSERIPVFRNIHFKNITCKYAGAPIAIFGLQEIPPESITFENIEITARRGIIINYSKNVQMKNVKLKLQTGPAVYIKGSSDLTFKDFEVTEGIHPLLEVTGEMVRKIKFFDEYNIDPDQIVIHPSVNRDEIMFHGK
jgi:polygalacturonase